MVSGEGVGTGSSELDDVLACAIRNVLGITDFYPPQAEGIEHGLDGKESDAIDPNSEWENLQLHTSACSRKF